MKLNITEFKNYEDFLLAFVEEISQKSPQRGFRYVAHLLEWSHSYFHDICHGKRRLTLEKAMEISWTFKFTLTEERYLVLLVQQTHRNAQIRNFAKEKIENWNYFEEPPKKSVSDESVYLNYLTEPLLLFIGLKKVVIGDDLEVIAAEIKKSFFVFENISLDEIINALEELIHHTYLSYQNKCLSLVKCPEPATFIRSKKNETSESLSSQVELDHRAVYEAYAKSWLSYLGHYRGDYCFLSGYYLLTPYDLSVIAGKIREISKEAIHLNRINLSKINEVDNLGLFLLNLNIMNSI